MVRQKERKKEKKHNKFALCTPSLNQHCNQFSTAATCLMSEMHKLYLLTCCLFPPLSHSFEDCRYKCINCKMQLQQKQCKFYSLQTKKKVYTPYLTNGRLHWQSRSKIDSLKPIWYATKALICHLIRAMALRETENA